MIKVTQYLMDRLQEPSTWRGIVWLLTALGISVAPDQVEGIIALGMTIAGAIGVFTKK